MTLDTPTRYLMHTINSLGEQISEHQVDVLIRNFQDYNIIGPIVARVLRATTSDQALRLVSPDQRDQVRMALFKNALASLVVPPA